MRLRVSESARLREDA